MMCPAYRRPMSPRQLGDEEGTLHGASKPQTGEQRGTILVAAAAHHGSLWSAGSGGRSTRERKQCMLHISVGVGGGQCRFSPVTLGGCGPIPHPSWHSTRGHAPEARLPAPAVLGVPACACVETGTVQVTRRRFFLVRGSDASIGQEAVRCSDADSALMRSFFITDNEVSQF